jgi:hypothetical protein
VYTVKSDQSSKPANLGIAIASLLPLGSLVLFGGARKRRGLHGLLSLLVLGLIVSVGTTGCSGSSGTSSTPMPTPTPLGTSQVSIVATAGTITRSTVIALTVQ